ncbi:unnamed protein product [Rotaria sordida]|uniref:G-protein coupled receptors family 1 profile domain-containing protein n=1 Tax=Rotaria sordida TaxID=392033 RepID=A0A814BQM8_9BILA|nr:unnamed protein product [Rotaria sordida]
MTSFDDDIYLLPHVIKFWLYLVILIPSIICSLFVLYYLLFDRTLRRALNNHTIIVLIFVCLICQLTIYPWMLYFYKNDNHWYRTLTFCSIWGFIDWGLYITQAILFAWASIEGHIFIFHDRWVTTRKKRFYIHYLPLILLMLYCLLFYSIVYFIPFCKNFVHDYVSPCISVCSYDNHAFFLWETVVHQILPNLTIIIASITLLIRILRQKHRMRQRIQWRKHRKMTIQLLSISFLYLIFSFPNTIMILMYLCGLPYHIGYNVKIYAEFISYLVTLFFPFVCIVSLPELRKKIKRILLLRPTAISVYPETFTIKYNRNTRHIGILDNKVQ